MNSSIAKCKLIVANWKMNGSINQAVADINFYLATYSRGFIHQVALALPYPFLSLANQLINTWYRANKNSDHNLGINGNSNTLALASQSVSRFSGNGAYTGEVSATLLAQVGVSYAIIAHSERRFHFASDDNKIASLKHKIINCLASGITPILCVGEDIACRNNNQYSHYIIKQLKFLKQIKEYLLDKHLVIAYEPIWAIGSGMSASSVQISEMMNIIKSFMQNNLPRVKITTLYGGSVGVSNKQTILSLLGVDGLLVGGASLKKDEFIQIIA